MKIGDLIKIKNGTSSGLVGIIVGIASPLPDDPFQQGFRVCWSDGEISWASYDFVEDCCKRVN